MRSLGHSSQNLEIIGYETSRKVLIWGNVKCSII